jgi:hypothetical protein
MTPTLLLAKTNDFCSAPIMVVRKGAPSVLLLLILGLPCLSCRSTRDPFASWTPQEGYEYLIVARQFAFGGISVNGHTSTGEVAFQAVLRSRDAVQIFKLVFSQGPNEGTAEGKLYALCGIRATDRAAFESYAKLIASTDADVTTMRGCIIGHEKAADVVKRITDGVYDSNFVTR